MKTEYDKCMAGELYDCHSPEFIEQKTKTSIINQQIKLRIMGFFFNNNRQQRAQQHRDNVAPWEKYAREDDRIQGWYCDHDHDPFDCDD